MGSDATITLSADLAPSDFHVFPNPQNFLNGKSFNSEEDPQAEFFSVFMRELPVLIRICHQNVA